MRDLSRRAAGRGRGRRHFPGRRLVVQLATAHQSPGSAPPAASTLCLSRSGILYLGEVHAAGPRCPVIGHMSAAPAPREETKIEIKI